MSSSGPKRHLVKSSIQFEFDEQILQVSLVPNSSSRVMVVTTNGLYVYSCEGKRKKLIMTNRTTLSKVPPFTENYGHGSVIKIKWMFGKCCLPILPIVKTRRPQERAVQCGGPIWFADNAEPIPSNTPNTKSYETLGQELIGNDKALKPFYDCAEDIANRHYS